MGWPLNPRPARAAVALKEQVQQARVKAHGSRLPSAGFGMIGDPAHAARKSDHNPERHYRNGQPYEVVRAVDVPLRVGDGNRHFAERLRKVAKGNRALGVKPHPAFGAKGYIISDGRIASARSKWKWRPYTAGPDMHTGHVHVSFGKRRAAFDSVRSFRLRPKDVS